jgi:hypothetical protein
VYKHNIQKATDGTMWIDSLEPMIYFMDEIKPRTKYVEFFEKKAHLHSDLISENTDFSNKLQKLIKCEAPLPDIPVNVIIPKTNPVEEESKQQLF